MYMLYGAQATNNPARYKLYGTRKAFTFGLRKLAIVNRVFRGTSKLAIELDASHHE